MKGDETYEAAAANLGRLGQLLDGSASEADQAALRERVLISSAAARPPRARWVALAAACVAAACLVAVGVLWRRPAAIEYRVTGPLVADGNWLSVPPDREAISVRFSEGTEIDLGPGSKGSVAEVTPDGARVVLGAGLLRARVVHRPHARWTVAAGPYAIEVTGTAFDVGWSAAGERLELSLHDGSVVVHGPSLGDGMRVGAGQRLVAHARTGTAEMSSLFAPEPSADPAPEPAAVPDPATPTPEPQATPRAAPSWSDLLAAGNFQGVIEAARARGIDATLSRGPLTDLAALSDAARYERDHALARRGLLAERSRFAGSADARAAAFVLGRMADDDGSSDEARRWYDAYLSESPKGAFAAEALGRKLVLLAHVGSADESRAVASEYLRRFPRGPHAAYARELLRGP